MIGPDQDLYEFPPQAWPRIRYYIELLRQQEIVTEQEIGRFLKEGWKFVSETKSGKIIVEKFLSPDDVVEAGVKAVRK
jgi:hypothetical protein